MDNLLAGAATARRMWRGATGVQGKSVGDASCIQPLRPAGEKTSARVVTARSASARSEQGDRPAHGAPQAAGSAVRPAKAPVWLRVFRLLRIPGGSRRPSA